MAKVDIPINVDWAESSVTFSLETSQGVGGDDPNWESCRTPQENVDLNLTVCSEPLWENSATLTGPDLSAVNAGITLPAAIDKTEFALFVLPAMEFQLPVLPVAIVYAPLGNGKSALSTYQITTTTASNMQIGNAQTTTTTLIRDDKTTYSGSVKGTDLETIDNKTSSGMFGSTTITLAGTWDNTEENDTQSGSGSTAQIINSQDLSTTFSVAATTTLDLTKIDYNTQPFWHDLIIGVVNPQFALWDYPGGHLIQPIGSVTTVGIPLQQLVSCITNRATKTETPNADNLPHFLPFAGPPSEGATRYVWMSSEDCRNIASLDQYYKKGTQSATPLAFRQLFGGNASLAGNSSLTVSSKQTTQLVAGQNSSAVETVKITAARTTTLTAAQEASVYIPDLFLKLTGTATGSWSNQLIEGNSTQVSFSTQDSNTLQSQTTATTILQDTSGLGVPVNVLQDSIFQGIAVQDTDMHYQASGFAARRL
jgi:hypothetical protein